jgi:hypothetical protein
MAAACVADSKKPSSKIMVENDENGSKKIRFSKLQSAHYISGISAPNIKVY